MKDLLFVVLFVFSMFFIAMSVFLLFIYFFSEYNFNSEIFYIQRVFYIMLLSSIINFCFVVYHLFIKNEIKEYKYQGMVQFDENKEPCICGISVKWLNHVSIKASSEKEAIK